MVVVEHQDDVLRRGLEVVDQRGDDDLERCTPAPGAGQPASVLRSGVDRCERGEDVGPEPVGSSSRASSDSQAVAALAGEPVGDQGGLAEPGRRRDQGERPVPAPVGEVA